MSWRRALQQREWQIQRPCGRSGPGRLEERVNTAVEAGLVLGGN